MLRSENKKSLPDQPALPPSPSSSSSLGPSLHLEGRISGTDNLEVHGQVQGEVSLEGHDLIVSTNGRINADIRAKNILIRGTVEGTIQASGTVSIHQEGRMTGDIAAARIAVAEGAHFTGTVKVISGR
jgi:cytoskeletal protein CcmA (bactofilin family)